MIKVHHREHNRETSPVGSRTDCNLEIGEDAAKRLIETSPETTVLCSPFKYVCCGRAKFHK